MTKRVHDHLSVLEARLGIFARTEFFRPNLAAARRMLAAASRTKVPRTAFLNISGEIDSCMADTVSRKLEASSNATDIVVFINSPGGHASSAFRIYSAIREHSAKRKKALIISRCSSAAIIPLLACDLRIARPNASILVHRAALALARLNSGERWTEDRLQLAADHVARTDGRIAELIVLRTGASNAWLKVELKNEKPLRLVDALSKGFIHEIEGLTRTPDAKWRRCVIAAGTGGGQVIGLPNYLFSSTFLAACSMARS